MNSAACDAKIAGLYDLLDTLGSGHFAVVKSARHVFTGEKVAVKVIDKNKLDDISKSNLFQEVRYMKLVQHPNVVRLYEVIDTQTKLYLILELGDGGDLYDYIMKHESGLSESLARDYFRQIVRAISYCHRLHVAHRDLKPENVVFFERLGVVKLTDFGFSNGFCPGQKLETSCGSLAYSAPEILLGDSYDAPAVDVWSLGVILYMLVCGQAPFSKANESETLTMIMDCKYTIPPHISNACRRLIGKMLIREPDKRANLTEIASDPWMTADDELPIDIDIPLVAKEQLSEEEKSVIIQKMVSGAIASQEEIMESIEKNDYNHITATYYLLAERKLRLNRQEERNARRPEVIGSLRTSSSKGTQQLLMPPPHHAVSRTPQDVPARSRKCSIVREEEDDEESCSGSPKSNAPVRRPSRSEGRLHVAATLRERDEQRHLQLADNMTRVTLSPSSDNPRSTNGRQRRRPRAGSCSSSDLSDDDSEKKKRAPCSAAGEAPPARARRDSHDDSSDGQERSGGGGGGGAGVARAAAVECRASSAGRARGSASTTGNGGTGGRRRGIRSESRLRESRSLNRIAEVEEAGGRWAGAGLVALCGRPLLRLISAARPTNAARRLQGFC